AFLGAPLDMGSGMRGAGWGPRGLRAWDPRPGGYGGATGDAPPPPPTPTSTPAGAGVAANVSTGSSATTPPSPSSGAPNMHVMLDPFQVLNIVDYGDAPIDNMSTERTMEPVRAKVREIAATGTIPF